MKKLSTTVLILVGLVSSLIAQQHSGVYQNKLVKDIIPSLEQQFDVRFYYQTQWLDSLAADAQFNNASLDEVLNGLFKGTSINYFVQNGEVILTNNVLITDTPPIASSLNKEESAPVKTMKGLVFAREYHGRVSDQNDKENFIHDIGNRSDLKVGGNSALVGYVKDDEKGEPIVGALVYINNPFKATTTDPNGFYSLSLPNGKHTVFYQYAGMRTTKRQVVVFSNGSLNVDMAVDVIALQEVVVESDKDRNIMDIKMGVESIDIEETKTVPLALGEKDIMKVATTMAGVQTLGEGAAGFNVRGGKADQNYVLMDGAPVYNPSHFFGFFSAFNADAVHNMDIYKGTMPAQFGGRLSSVFDIKSKTANKEKFSGSGGISPVTSRITLETPLIKDKSSILLSGRATYSDWVLNQIDNANFSETNVSFFDLMSTIDHQFDDKNSLKATVYYSKDKFRLASDTLFSFSDYNYQNLSWSLQYKRTISDQIEANAHVAHAHYDYAVEYDETEETAFKQDFGLDDYSLSLGLGFYPSETEKYNFGLTGRSYVINPGSKRPLGELSIQLPEVLQKERGREYAAYLSGERELVTNLVLNLGLRYVHFQSLGPFEENIYNPDFPLSEETLIGTRDYGSGEAIETFGGPELRASLRYAFSQFTSVKLGYGRTRQFVHALSNSASISPTDTWRVSGSYLKPQVSDQVSLGVFQNLMGGNVELSLEGYYKKLDNLVDLETGTTFLLNPSIETSVIQGKGKSYGAEFSLKKSGRLNGWLNYTYARTFIQLNGETREQIINNGEFFPTGYDKPHTLNIVSNYKINKRFSASLNTVYSTGAPTTLAIGQYTVQGIETIEYSNRNQERIPDYFRVDIGINLEGNHKIKKLAHAFWTLSIYNVLGRDNPYSIFFNTNEGEINGYKLIIFGSPIPTLTYNFKF